MRTFKDANMLYGRADYTAAIEEYEQVIEVLGQNPDSELAQVMTAAYFYIGNSYDNLYKPALRGDVENDNYLDHAVEYYRLGSERCADPRPEEAVDAVSRGRVRSRQEERPRLVRADPAGDDPARSRPIRTTTSLSRGSTRRPVSTRTRRS